MSEPVQRFIDALGRLEADREVEPIVELFADDCELQNVTVGGDFHGREGARRFWSEDHAAFGDARSEFRNVIEADGRAALEWRRGDIPGVSILELEEGRITRFMAYFHPRELGRQTL